MTPKYRAAAIVLAIILSAVPMRAADASGTWTLSFDTPVGSMDYTYVLKVDGTTLTGTAKSANGETQLTGGKVEGGKISFVETLDFQGMTIVVKYSGTMTNDDEIKFSRVIGDFGTDEIVAKRVK